MNKFCKHCKVEHPLTSDFWYRLDATPECKGRVLEKTKQYRQVNKERIIERKKKYRQVNKEQISEYQKQYRQVNKEQISEKQKQRYHTDPQFKLAQLLRRRLRGALKGNFKRGSAVRDLGCSIDELWVHLESMFTEGMTRENHGTYWEIDHIRPLASFDLADKEQLLQAVYYTNLQPLTVEDNRRKRAKYGDGNEYHGLFSEEISTEGYTGKRAE
jgi:hypothetical protein